jgi:hypothetical protein
LMPFLWAGSRVYCMDYTAVRDEPDMKIAARIWLV